MKPLYLLAAAAFLAGVSCERHSFEETKALHEQHKDHAEEGDHADHGQDDHSDHGH